MKILLQLHQQHSGGVLTQVPGTLQKRLAPWAEETTFHQYPMGNLLTQSCRQTHYGIYLFELSLPDACRFYIVQPPMMTMQYTLAGNNSGSLTAIPETGYYTMAHLNGEPQEIKVNAACKLQWLQIEWERGYTPALVEEGITLAPVAQDGNKPVEFPITYEVSSLIKQLITCNFQAPMRWYHIKLIHTQLIVHFLKSVSESVPHRLLRNPAHTEILLTIHKLVRARPHIHNYRVEEMCNRFAISAGCLKEGFLRMFGIAYSDFIEQQYMAHAKHLLENTNNALEDIAELLGYGALSAFSRSYKKYYGINPLRCRDKKRAEMVNNPAEMITIL